MTIVTSTRSEPTQSSTEKDKNSTEKNESLFFHLGFEFVKTLEPHNTNLITHDFYLPNTKPKKRPDYLIL